VGRRHERNFHILGAKGDLGLPDHHPLVHRQGDAEGQAASGQIKGTVSQEFTELGLTKGHGWCLIFLGAPYYCC
jgi:hypothetical protein